MKVQKFQFLIFESYNRNIYKNNENRFFWLLVFNNFVLTKWKKGEFDFWGSIFAFLNFFKCFIIANWFKTCQGFKLLFKIVYLKIGTELKNFSFFFIQNNNSKLKIRFACGILVDAKKITWRGLCNVIVRCFR